MKKITLLSLLCFAITKTQSQNYLLNFTASGITSTIDSIHVVNLSKCLSLSIHGNDTLKLNPIAGMNDIMGSDNSGLLIYPNPFNQSCKIEFTNTKQGLSSIEIFDVTGRSIAKKEQVLSIGKHTFSLSNLGTGVYFINVSTLEHVFTSRIISFNDFPTSTAKIDYERNGSLSSENYNLKDTKIITQMQYHTGEVLFFEAFSGNYPSVLKTLVPTQSQVVDFEFISNAIIGNTVICHDTTGVIFSVPNLLNHLYTWSYLGNGFTIASGANTNAISTNFSNNATSGTLSVIIKNHCDTLAPRTLNIEIKTPPAQPSAISGNINPCSNETNLTYSVTDITGVNFNWIVPNGWVITNGQTTNQITVTAGSSAGNIIVTQSNLCGNGPLQTLSVTPIVLPLTPTAGSNITSATQIEWNWNIVSNATGYKWNTNNNYLTAIDLGNNTTYIDSNLVCDSSYVRYVWSYNLCGYSAPILLSASTDTCIATGVCGMSQFTDYRDGNIYQVVSIGYQCWMAQNLKYLPSVVAPSTGSQTVSYYYVQGYQGTDVVSAKTTTNYSTYGVLYNWPAAMDGANSSINNPSGVQGVCPNGWHLPSDAEWKQLEIYLGMSQAQADAVGSRGTNEGSKLAGNASLWISDSLTNNIEFGITEFTALASGYRNTINSFSGLTGEGAYYTATESSTPLAWGRYFGYNSPRLVRYSDNKAFGYAVRCVKN